MSIVTKNSPLLLALACAFLVLEPGNALGDDMAPDVIAIPKGSYISGSSRQERDYAYLLDEKAYGHSVTRQQKWYENETMPRRISLGHFFIMKNLVTNGQYARFLKDTGHAIPRVTRVNWNTYGLVHSFAATKPYQWKTRTPPKDRRDHPVVLVSHKDASAYAKWLSQKTGQKWRLPREQEWEKAARGPDGRYFPWGNQFHPLKLNSHDKGKFATTAIGRFPEGASPYGLLDAAGQVYEWTATKTGKTRYIVKGGSWDDKGCGVCRPAARHGRPRDIKHILIGFRLVRENETGK